MIRGFSGRGLIAVFSATVIVTAGTIFAKAVGFGKEVFIAYELGPGQQLDAFLFAYIFPAVLMNVIGGALQVAFLPQYLDTSMKKSPAEAALLAGEAAALVGGLQLLAQVLLVPVIIFAIPWLTGGFDEATQQLTRQLVPMLMPLVVLTSITSFWAAILNAHGRFAAVALVPALTPITVVLALVAPLPISAAYRLALGTVFGSVLELGILGIFAHRLMPALLLRPKAWRPEYSQMLRQFWPAVASSLLMTGTLFIDQAFAAHLPAGSVSQLSYGTRLTGVAGAILVSIVTAIALPSLSRLAAEQQYDKLRRAFILGAIVVSTASLPFAAICSFGAERIVEFMYLRGEFSAADAEAVAAVQHLHAWHIPVFAIGMLSVRALAAVKATWVMMLGSTLNLVVNAAVNWNFVPLLGVAGIGLATTAMYTASAVFLATAFLIVVNRKRSQ